MVRAQLEPARAGASLLVAAGRYAIFHAGRECGEERWQIESTVTGLVVTGEHVIELPHPIPGRQAWRATLTPEWRVTGLEIQWSVAQRRLHAIHAADGARWRGRFDYAGQVREQQGDYPDLCEVDYVSPLFHTFFLARRDFALGGEHEFPVLRIGPPWMAVSPERMRVRCVERGPAETPHGPVEARRYRVSLPPLGEAEGTTFWADRRGIVLETHDGPEPSALAMKLIEYTGPPLGGLDGGG